MHTVHESNADAVLFRSGCCDGPFCGLHDTQRIHTRIEGRYYVTICLGGTHGLSLKKTPDVASRTENAPACDFRWSAHRRSAVTQVFSPPTAQTRCVTPVILLRDFRTRTQSHADYAAARCHYCWLALVARSFTRSDLITEFTLVMPIHTHSFTERSEQRARCAHAVSLTTYLCGLYIRIPHAYAVTTHCNI